MTQRLGSTVEHGGVRLQQRRAFFDWIYAILPLLWASSSESCKLVGWSKDEEHHS